jgi:hypothetical protein
MPASATYELIASQTLASSAATITFSSIPQTYTDIEIRAVGRNTGAASQFNLRFNGDSGANYGYTFLDDDGGAAARSTRATNRTQADVGGLFGSSQAASLFAPNTFYIMSYTNTSMAKSVIGMAVASNSSGIVLDYVQTVVSVWRNTAAITSVTCVTNANSFDVGTTVALYGIKAA